jgi:hypothetical protein
MKTIAVTIDEPTLNFSPVDLFLLRQYAENA